MRRKFESLVNTEGFQTKVHVYIWQLPFESLVNTEGFQTKSDSACADDQFESLVNTEGFQTCWIWVTGNTCLRVLLIQKDFKQGVGEPIK